MTKFYKIPVDKCHKNHISDSGVVYFIIGNAEIIDDEEEICKKNEPDFLQKTSPVELPEKYKFPNKYVPSENKFNQLADFCDQQQTQINELYTECRRLWENMPNSIPAYENNQRILNSEESYGFDNNTHDD